MENKLHPLQEKILKLFKDNNNTLPSFRKITRAINVSSTNTVAYHVNQLKEKGYLEISKSPQGIAKFSLKTLLSFDNKPGLYILLKNKQPFYIGTSENIKKDLIENIIGINNPPILELKNHIESITIAYNILDNKQEQVELKNHLIEFYEKQGIKLN